ncbi:MAG: hypothetical protein CMP18_01660 [Rickettsiales bacterium]|jgi:protein-disulfide isomerase|nr:hypothetical protein [Rickettsiales bacterium]|tara:strand:- start:18309 stop:19094 length:786 start_codon:yes stop_codon:yes gene_type:complete
MNVKLIAKNILSNKIIISVVIAIALLSFLFLGNNSNSTNQAANNQEFEQIIAKWISDNPEAILESIQNMQKKIMEEQMAKSRQNLSQKTSELYDDKDNPVISNGNHDVTIIEFFDYSCGYCKRASSTIEKLLQQDKKLRVIHKHYPILGQPSNEMAQIALAINLSQPKLYSKFHMELMKNTNRGKQAALDIAKKIGANIDLINETLSTKQANIENMIKNNINLGSSIGVNGTPGFVIGDELIPGAIDINTFKTKISAVRSK